jgi:hypothetical protein
MEHSILQYAAVGYLRAGFSQTLRLLLPNVRFRLNTLVFALLPFLYNRRRHRRYIDKVVGGHPIQSFGAA